MKRTSSFSPYQQGARPKFEPVRKPAAATRGAADFLRAHDSMAALLPAVTRLAALQKDCAAILPEIFNSCEVLLFESGQLTLSVPNAALAAKLKQKLPKLKDSLVQHAWQVNAIRLKVQVRQPVKKQFVSKRLPMSQTAMSAWSNLGSTLDDTPANAALKAAVEALVKRQQEKE